MSINQIHNMEMVLEWVKACPFEYRVSSYQGGAISVRVEVPEHEIEWAVDDGQHYETEKPKDEEKSNGSDD
tara:strand:+ start:138 stop:350 length:213 start_codon:yes stop_codon:yes gene_type:complete